MTINRFPKMAALQRFRAEKLGYPQDLAKAIWIAEATKYAIFKNFALSKKESIEKKLINTGKVKNYEELNNLNFDENFKIHFKNNLPFVGWKLFKPEDYDKYFKKFTPEITNQIENWAKNIIHQTPEEILKNESKFFNQVWKKVRDDQIIK